MVMLTTGGIVGNAAAPEPKENMGRPEPRIDGRLKVTGAARYASKLFNPSFLTERNLPVPGWLGASGDPLPDWRA